MDALLYLTDEERIRLLLRAPETRSYEAGDVIIREGEYNEEIFIVTGGCVQAEKADDPTLTLRPLGPGEAFGEMSLLDGSPTSLNVIAREATEVYVLHLGNMADLLEEDAVLASHLYHSIAIILARRLRDRA